MLKYIKTIAILIALSGSILVSCQKDDYFIDTGLHDPKYDGTILDYLKAKPVLFDSLVLAINAAQMQDVFEKENITFFAPPSAVIYKAIKNLNTELRFSGKDTVAKLEQIKPQVWKEMLSMYVFKGSYRLKDIPQIDTAAINAFPGQGYTSYGGRAMNLGVLYNDAGGVKYVGYRQLFISYIPDYSNPKLGLINAPIATSDIQPTNGVLHVIRFHKHDLGFDNYRFITAATSAGITPLKELN